MSPTPLPQQRPSVWERLLVTIELKWTQCQPRLAGVLAVFRIMLGPKRGKRP